MTICMTDPTESHLRDCLARELVKNPEATRDIWRHWSDPKHRNAKPPEWLADMRERIARAKGER